MTEIQAIQNGPGRPRSEATTQRMLAATEVLLKQQGPRFTLNEVATAGRMSMASIYARFTSKEDLIRAVQERVLADLEQQILDGLEHVRQNAAGPHQMISKLVEIYSEAHLNKADLIRHIYVASQDDVRLHVRGVESYSKMIAAALETVMTFLPRQEFEQRLDDIGMTLKIFFHALSSYVGFSHAAEPIDQLEWDRFKRINAEAIFRSTQ